MTETETETETPQVEIDPETLAACIETNVQRGYDVLTSPGAFDPERYEKLLQETFHPELKVVVMPSINAIRKCALDKPVWPASRVFLCNRYYWVQTYRDLGVAIDPLPLQEDIMAFGPWFAIQDEGTIYCCEAPEQVTVDEDHNLHSFGPQPSIVFKDGSEQFHHHGVAISFKMAVTPAKYVAEDFDIETANTETTRILGERVGWGKFFELLGTSEVLDSMERLAGAEPCTYRLVRVGPVTCLQMQSPEVLDGTRPVYLEPVHPELETCAAALKWQCTNLSPRECNDNPDIAFLQES